MVLMIRLKRRNWNYEHVYDINVREHTFHTLRYLYDTTRHTDIMRNKIGKICMLSGSIVLRFVIERVPIILIINYSSSFGIDCEEYSEEMAVATFLNESASIRSSSIPPCQIWKGMKKQFFFFKLISSCWKWPGRNSSILLNVIFTRTIWWQILVKNESPSFGSIFHLS